MPNEEERFNRALNWARNNQLFQELTFKAHEKEFVKLANEGQAPKAIFIGCSDSRVLPELLTNSKPGDLFVVRSAGNFIPKWNPDIEWDGIAASIIYALNVLKINEVIICGHSNCGAINGLYDPDLLEQHPYLSNWVKFGQPAKKIAMSEKYAADATKNLVNVTARLSVLFQLKTFLEYPNVRQRVEEGTLQLHGWFFDIATGVLEYYDPDKGDFVSMQELINIESARHVDKDFEIK